jgi:hypothetical protein
MQLLIRVRGGLVVGYLDGDGLVWATPGLPTDASATAATASTFARRPSRQRRSVRAALLLLPHCDSDGAEFALCENPKPC